jgi:16S rRNA (guanine966-N2)-methyltransferase
MRIIAGIYRGRNLKSLPTLDTRPTKDMVKGAIFSIIQFEIVNASVLDLFAGSGSIGIEALSRGAKLAVFNDKSRAAYNLIKDNLESLNVKQDAYQLINLDYNLALAHIHNEKKKFDFIYLDPPYKLKIIDDLITQIMNLQLLSKSGVIMAEVDKRDPETNYPGLKLKVHQYGNTKLLVYRVNPV